MSTSTIGSLLRRNKGTVSRHMIKKSHLKKAKPFGRRPFITPQILNKLMRVRDRLIKKADALYDVTLKEVRATAGVSASERTIHRAFRKQGIRFRPFSEKPPLTKDDVEERYAFGLKYEDRSGDTWLKTPHMTIDCKKFPVYLNGYARDFAARRKARGVYRGRKQLLRKGYVRPPAASSGSFQGGKSINICAGISGDRLVMWHEIPKQWCAKQAVDMYKESLLPALKKVHPHMASKRKPAWVVMEDNDPTGYKSKMAVKCKAALGIQIMTMPKRSPDLNVLDYRIWAEINRRMRKTERGWPKSRKESRVEFKARLRRTAFSLPRSFIKAAMQDMVRRCKLLVEEKGWYFKE